MQKRLFLPILLLSAVLLAGCSPQQAHMDYITTEQAKAAALEAAALSSGEVTFTAAALNERNGLEYYAVDFTANGQQYACDIDALTGAVLNYQGPTASPSPADDGLVTDADTFHSVPSPTPEQPAGSQTTPVVQTLPAVQQPAANIGSTSGGISEADAKALALAQVPGAVETDIWEFEVDYDDGRLEYEGKIYYDHMEYEFEIDGYSGAFRNWEVESIYDD